MAVKVYVIFLLSLAYLGECSSRQVLVKECPGNSQCTAIQECSGMLELLGSKDQEKIDQVRKNSCGFMEVCCEMGCPVVPLGKDLIPKECGMPKQGKIDPLIIGGEIAPRGAYPWMVALYKQEFPADKIFYCGGSLISERYVLTAAQCVTEMGNKTNVVHIGDWNLSTDIDCDNDTGIETTCSQPHIVAGVEEIIIHPHYNVRARFSDDIALIRLDRPVPLTSNHIKTICLPPQDLHKKDEDIKFIAMGWGLIGNFSTSDVLLRVELPLIDREVCRKFYGCQFVDKQVCVGGVKGVNFCFGDSGGPMVLSGQPGKPYVQMGIAAGGMAHVCCEHESPSIITLVSPYVDWIHQNLKQ